MVNALAFGPRGPAFASRCNVIKLLPSFYTTVLECAISFGRHNYQHIMDTHKIVAVASLGVATRLCRKLPKSAYVLHWLQPFKNFYRYTCEVEVSQVSQCDKLLSDEISIALCVVVSAGRKVISERPRSVSPPADVTSRRNTEVTSAVTQPSQHGGTFDRSRGTCRHIQVLYSFNHSQNLSSSPVMSGVNIHLTVCVCNNGRENYCHCTEVVITPWLHKRTY